MAEEPDVIRQQIDDTRSSLTDKLETLENQVRGTVENAKATVEETIATVKSTVQDTVHTVKRTFDLEYQTRQHPWALVGGSVVAGLLAGTLLNRRRHVESRIIARHVDQPTGNGMTHAERLISSDHEQHNGVAREQQPGFLGKLYHQFESEIDQLKEIAIGAAMGVARDLVKQSLPQLSPHIDDVMNSATKKMGGEPIHRSMIEPAPATGGRFSG